MRVSYAYLSPNTGKHGGCDSSPETLAGWKAICAAILRSVTLIRRFCRLTNQLIARIAGSTAFDDRRASRRIFNECAPAMDVSLVTSKGLNCTSYLGNPRFGQQEQDRLATAPSFLRHDQNFDQ
jgi:hypothetical protein